MHLILMFAAAATGGLLLQRLHVPGGLIVGAMIGAATYSLLHGDGAIDIPGPLQTGAFLVLGATIGASVNRETVAGLGGVLLPALLSAVLIILAGIGIASLLQVLGLAPPAAVLATSPGALTALSAAAAEHGTGAAEVALFHTVRVVLVLLTLPALLILLPAEGG